MSTTQLSDVRREYLAAGLHEDNLVRDPIRQFDAWMQDALAVDPKDATSMTLATADQSGMPSARIVLLKEFSSEGFIWFTNYSSEKGEQLAANPQAELLFYWSMLERQVRIRGRVEKIDRIESETYFHSRPEGSQRSASVSQQSQPVESRSVLEQAVNELAKMTEVACPDNWGGYRLVPSRFEFWQGRESRLHDRFSFEPSDTGWVITRLQP
jgi:pyridoxamine 5'-phosphate oxidase